MDYTDCIFPGPTRRFSRIGRAVSLFSLLQIVLTFTVVSSAFKGVVTGRG